MAVRTMTKNISQAEISLHTPYRPCAAYFLKSDCAEYVTEDCFAIYDRVDPFLTLIFDETKLRLIGFKLKGFKHIFERHLKPLYRFNDMQFVQLATAIEAVITEIGDKMFEGDSVRVSKYKAALKLAANDNVRLSSFAFAKAA